MVFLDKTKKVFIIYIIYLGSKILINLAQKTWIALLLSRKVIFLKNHSDYINIFLKKLNAKPPKRLNIISKNLFIDVYNLLVNSHNILLLIIIIYLLISRIFSY